MGKIDLKAKELSEQIDALVHHFLSEQHHSDVVACDHLNKQEVRVIDILGKKGVCIMSELAEQMLLAVSTLTGIIDSMVQKDIVIRERSDSDRRIVQVRLTENGNQIYQEHKTNHLKMSNRILATLDDDEQDAFLSLFRKITDRMKDVAKVSTRA